MHTVLNFAYLRPLSRSQLQAGGERVEGHIDQHIVRTPLSAEKSPWPPATGATAWRWAAGKLRTGYAT
jgi:hypothetical protein